MENTFPSIDIEEAARRIAPYVLRTPLIPFRSSGLELWAKAECLQPIGAFKLRGAFNMLLQLPQGTKGVVAHSSGNHAQAVARAAKILGIKAVVVMPQDAPTLKRTRTEADGAEVIVVSNDSDERARVAGEVASSRGFVSVPPYDHPMIIAGQGTAALEIVVDRPNLERFYCPVSGGGLISGCALAFAARAPHVEVIGVEPARANDTALSLARGVRTKIDPPETMADGLRVRIPGEVTWPIIQRHVSRIALVEEQEMIEAIDFAWREMRLVLEPSGAAALAAALREASSAAASKNRMPTTAVLLSGGNIDPSLFARIVSHGTSAGTAT